MPKKSRRVAAKQAELGQKKRRTARHTSGVEAQVDIAQVGTATQVETPEAATSAESAAPTPALDIPKVIPQKRPAPAASHGVLNPYIWPEIKRIGIITGLALTILAVLTILLR